MPVARPLRRPDLNNAIPSVDDGNPRHRVCEGVAAATAITSLAVTATTTTMFAVGLGSEITTVTTIRMLIRALAALSVAVSGLGDEGSVCCCLGHYLLLVLFMERTLSARKKEKVIATE